MPFRLKNSRTENIYISIILNDEAKILKEGNKEVTIRTDQLSCNPESSLIIGSVNNFYKNTVLVF